MIERRGKREQGAHAGCGAFVADVVPGRPPAVPSSGVRVAQKGQMQTTVWLPLASVA